ncbi:MAG: winged helix DNA-binding domain-containing protein [Streptosporangiaceae bacterium]
MRSMTVAERRRRLAVRHGLAHQAIAVNVLPDAVPLDAVPLDAVPLDAVPSAGQAGAGRPGSPADVARAMVALHATDPATVYLSIRARTGPPITAADIEDSLYERRELVRMLAMRRTVFAVPAESVPIVQVSTSDRVGRDQRTRLLRLLAAADVAARPETWLADVERSVLAALAARGGMATAAELSADEPRLKTTLLLAAGKQYQASQAITSRVLLVLAAQGQIVRGRPVGSWLSQQYRWSLAGHWLPDRTGEATRDGPAAQTTTVGEETARAALARQWLAAFGPAPIADLKWWSGWTATQVRKAMAECGAVEVEIAGTTGAVLPDDLAPTGEPAPWAALLPALDPTVMGWQDRSWFLDPHGPALFDTFGNAGPTIWLNGRVVGGWAQRADGEIALRVFEDVGAEGRRLIGDEAGRLAAWLGEVRVTPRFRTPTERSLSA